MPELFFSYENILYILAFFINNAEEILHKWILISVFLDSMSGAMEYGTNLYCIIL